MDHKVNHNNLCVQTHFKVNANANEITNRRKKLSQIYYTHACNSFSFPIQFGFCSLLCPLDTVFAYICDHSNWFVLIVRMLHFLPRPLLHFEFFQLIVHQLAFPVRVCVSNTYAYEIFAKVARRIIVCLNL